MITIEDVFVRRVLNCLGRGKSTKEEIETLYDRLYPPLRIPLSLHDIGRVIVHKYSPNKKSVDVVNVLEFLQKEGYCAYEITCLTDCEVPLDVRLYFITEKGKAVLSRRK